MDTGADKTENGCAGTLRGSLVYGAQSMHLGIVTDPSPYSKIKYGDGNSGPFSPLFCEGLEVFWYDHDWATPP